MFHLSNEQRMLIETVRRFIHEECRPLEDEVEASGELADTQARALHDKARALGLYAMNMPAEHGGGGLSVVDRMLCEEQFGHTTDILIRRAFGNVYEPLLECRGEQVARWLLPAVQGARTCAIAITEPGAGSDAQGIRTRAEPQADGSWRLHGSKHFISDGWWSDFFLVSARTGEREISMFMVDKGLPGFTLGKDQKMMACAARRTSSSSSTACRWSRWPCWGSAARASSSPWARSTSCAWPRWARAPWARPATCSS